MKTKAKIKEIFASIQGEGPFIGTQQLFIRFCNCNLDCDYCDTDFSQTKEYKEYSVEELLEEVKKYDLKTVHYISLTGGEPLMHADFLKEFLPKINLPIYLETNATMGSEIAKLLEYTDIISADIKLPSSSGIKNSFELHQKFFNALKQAAIDCAVTKQFDCNAHNFFAKIVFDEKITDEEIGNCVSLAKEHDFELILQPKMNGDNLSMSSEKIIEIFNKFLQQYNKVRLIPQTHKFLKVR